MRGTVLPEADRVVREDVNHRQVGQRSEADRRPHVIRKNEERRSDRPDATVQGESVQDRAHPMLARSEEHTSELQSQSNLVCRLLLEKKKHTPVLALDVSH